MGYIPSCPASNWVQGLLGIVVTLGAVVTLNSCWIGAILELPELPEMFQVPAPIHKLVIS